MSEWVKLITPLLFVALTSIIAFFMTDPIDDLRQGRTIVYSLDRQGNSVTLHLANVSRQTVGKVEFNLRCREPALSETRPAEGNRPCFRKDSHGWLRTQNRGPVVTRDVDRTFGNGPGQIGFSVTLLPDARFDVQVMSVEGRANDVRFYYDPAASEPIELRLVEADRVVGFIVLNYVEVLVWVFGISLGLVVLAGGAAVLLALWQFLALPFYRLLTQSGSRLSATKCSAQIKDPSMPNEGERE